MCYLNPSRSGCVSIVWSLSVWNAEVDNQSDPKEKIFSSKSPPPSFYRKPHPSGVCRHAKSVPRSCSRFRFQSHLRTHHHHPHPAPKNNTAHYAGASGSLRSAGRPNYGQHGPEQLQQVRVLSGPTHCHLVYLATHVAQHGWAVSLCAAVAALVPRVQESSSSWIGRCWGMLFLLLSPKQPSALGRATKNHPPQVSSSI